MATIHKILIVDQDRKITDVLKLALKSSFDIDIVESGKQAIYKADIYNYDCVILDLDLPDINGSALCQQLRQRGLGAPLLILSSEDNVLKKIAVLDAGANDYITKPFSLGELKARLRVLVRSYSDSVATRLEPLSRFGVSINKQTFEVIRNGVRITLRKKEFSILEYLMSRAGIVISREELLGALWQNSDELWTNTLDVHIKYLRDKVDRPFDSPLIHTVHGQGYKFESLVQPITKVLKKSKNVNK